MPSPKLPQKFESQVLRVAAVFLVFWFVCLHGVPGFAADSPDILRIRYSSDSVKTRVVFDLDLPASFEVREIKDPDRLAINLPRCTFAQSNSIKVADGLLQQIRRNPGKDRAQVVFDLVAGCRFNAFSLPAEKGRPYRVVVDLFHGGELCEKVPDVENVPANVQDELPPFVVVIDPGHGGTDPGAIRGHIQEKDVVLDVSLELAKVLNALPGYQAVLTRDTDSFCSLERRVELASELKGDLFLSVHCNTHKRKQVGGMEVYFLSLQGATDREARELADKENAADLVGLGSMESCDDLVLSILMDMRMTMVLNESARLAEHLLLSADSSALVKKRKAKQAAFQVLKSLAMPSALVELAYLSNSGDMKVLENRQGRTQLAGVLAEGVVLWRHDQAGFALLKNGPSGVWRQQYAVRQGDSLWGLAHRHGTTIQEITLTNQLQSPALVVGQVLKLPQGIEGP